jgi:predicted translin family RNA/ssDNA-binding protein
MSEPLDPVKVAMLARELISARARIAELEETITTMQRDHADEIEQVTRDTSAMVVEAAREGVAVAEASPESAGDALREFKAIADYLMTKLGKSAEQAAGETVEVTADDSKVVDGGALDAKSDDVDEL